MSILSKKIKRDCLDANAYMEHIGTYLVSPTNFR